MSVAIIAVHVLPRLRLSLQAEVCGGTVAVPAEGERGHLAVTDMEPASGIGPPCRAATCPRRRRTKDGGDGADQEDPATGVAANHPGGPVEAGQVLGRGLAARRAGPHAFLTGNPI